MFNNTKQVKIQEQKKIKEQDSSSHEDFETLCKELEQQYGIKNEINPELLKPLPYEKFFAPADWVIEKYGDTQRQ